MLQILQEASATDCTSLLWNPPYFLCICAAAELLYKSVYGDEVRARVFVKIFLALVCLQELNSTP